MVKVKGKNSLINQFVNAFDVTNMHFWFPVVFFLSPRDYSAINSLSPKFVEWQEGCMMFEQLLLWRGFIHSNRLIRSYCIPHCTSKWLDGGYKSSMLLTSSLFLALSVIRQLRKQLLQIKLSTSRLSWFGLNSSVFRIIWRKNVSANDIVTGNNFRSVGAYHHASSIWCGLWY